MPTVTVGQMNYLPIATVGQFQMPIVTVGQFQMPTVTVSQFQIHAYSHYRPNQLPANSDCRPISDAYSHCRPISNAYSHCRPISDANRVSLLNDFAWSSRCAI